MRTIICYILFCIFFSIDCPLFAQPQALGDLDMLRIQDISSGKIEIRGKFGQRLGTAMRGQFRMIKIGKDTDNYELEVRCENSGQMKIDRYQVDGLYRTAEVYGQIDLDFEEMKDYWFFEGMESLGLPADFPRGNGIFIKSGFFKQKVNLRIIVAANVSEGIETKVAVHSNKPEKIVLAQDIENGKHTIMGRLNSPLGTMLKGTVTVTRGGKNDNDFEVRVTTESNESAIFAKSEIRLRSPGGLGANLAALKSKEVWTDIEFFENAALTGAPRELEIVGLKIARGEDWFDCRSQLFLCIPD